MGLTGNWDGRISRRTLLRASGSATAAYILLGRSATSASATPPFAGYPFRLGVASGDPTPDGVVLWTRLAPHPFEVRGGMPEVPVGVEWKLAERASMRWVVRAGRALAMPALAHSVHVELAGLEPDREYFYQFKYGGDLSPVGRTRTAPLPGAELRSLSFAFA